MKVVNFGNSQTSTVAVAIKKVGVSSVFLMMITGFKE